jgi:hypothetical protein
MPNLLPVIFQQANRQTPVTLPGFRVVAGFCRHAVVLLITDQSFVASSQRRGEIREKSEVLTPVGQ